MACPNCTAECYNTHNSTVIQDPITKEWKAFRACPRCVVQCHHVYKHTNNTVARPLQFFKVLVGDFSMALHLPPAFVLTLENTSFQAAFLEDPYGQVWRVKLSSTDRGMAFQEGWKFFVSEHGLELGDFLIFRHLGEMHFKVQIFGKSCCEKSQRTTTHTTFLTKQPKTENLDVKCEMQRHNSKTEQDIPYEIRTVSMEIQHKEMKSNDGLNLVPKTCKRKKEFLNRESPKTKGQCSEMKSAEIKNGETQYAQSYFVSCRQPVTEAEKKMALAKAKMFHSNNPFVLMVLRKSQVYQGFWLSFPKEFHTKWLPKDRTPFTLIAPSGMKTKAKYLGDRKNPGLSGGWRAFALANDLEEDDVCVFELQTMTNIYTMKVHIFRVVENHVPHTKVDVKKKD